MKKKQLLDEVRKMQKIAGILKEDTFDSTPRVKVGDNVWYSFEGEQGDTGTVTDIARNWDEVLQKGGDNLEDWEYLFNDKEYADSVGYDSFEDFQAEYVDKHKSGNWFKVDAGGDYEGWYPAEYVTPHRR